MSSPTKRRRVLDRLISGVKLKLKFQAASGCNWGIEEKIGRKLACLAKLSALGLSPTSGEVSIRLNVLHLGRLDGGFRYWKDRVSYL
jgi:hypothetical protein